MSRIPLTAAVAALAFVCGLGGIAVASGDYGPPNDTIVKVEGSWANGFAVYHYDGTTEFPPTGSETLAECREYDARVDRVRCKAQFRTWYRDLGDLKQALDWAHAR